MRNDYFAGDDANLLATVAIKHPDLVHLVLPPSLSSPSSLDGAQVARFYMRSYLAKVSP